MKRARAGIVTRGLLTALLLAGGSTVVGAAPVHVEVVALYRDAAVLLIEDQTRMLRVGETVTEGIRLLSANSEEAVIEVDGERRILTLSRRMGGEFKPAEKVQVSIARNPSGHYLIVGAINGVPVRFLVDTGATVVAMNEEHARRLGIDYRAGMRSTAATASGVAATYQVMLDRVDVGAISVGPVAAAVIEGSQLADVLLGMSFLQRVEMTESAGVLVLTSKLQ